MSTSTYAIGIDLGGTKVKIALVSSFGDLINAEHFPFKSASNPTAMIARLADHIDHLVQQSPQPPLGIGIGVAGQIQPGTGRLTFAPNLGWKNIPLQTELCRATRYPVMVMNDVRAATWGEWIHGHGHGSADLLCIFLGTGIGGGVVSGGHLLTGCSNTAGEIGHIPIDLNGPPCTCGGRGCLEALASGWAIAHQAQQAAIANPAAAANMLDFAGNAVEALTAKQVIQAATQGDSLAKHLLTNANQAFAAGMVGLVNAFNPALLILGGGLFEAQPHLLSKVEQTIGERALPSAREAVRVLPAKLGSDAGVIGAASCVIQTSQKAQTN